jgi:hypothetical protein
MFIPPEFFLPLDGKPPRCHNFRKPLIYSGRRADRLILRRTISRCFEYSSIRAFFPLPGKNHAAAVALSIKSAVPNLIYFILCFFKLCVNHF